MKKPNIIFFLIDDMGWRDLACTGSSFYETPNIDRIAREGMLFTDGYASCPVCSPTRASILSGKYPASVGVTNYIAGQAKGKLLEAPYFHYLPSSEKSMAATLQENGYTTWHVGKWHCGGPDHYPEKHGFDVNIGGCEWGCPKKGYFSPWHIPALENYDVPDGVYLTDFLTDKTVELMESHDGRRPFFLNMWYYQVHTPIQAKPEKIKKYEKKAQDMGIDQSQALEEGEPHPGDHKKHVPIVRRRIQSDPAYAAMIESLDESVGRILESLEKMGEADNTIIIFTSDNGGLSTSEGSPTCNAPLSEGKGWMYEGGTREPMLIKWPGVTKPGSTCDVPITSPDFYPTLLELAGLPLMPEQHTDGVSFIPLLRGETSLDRDAIYWHYPHYGNQGGTPGSSIREGDWKLIEFFENGTLELYNLRDDISENNNLADAEPDIRDRLHAKLVKWREDVGAKLPVPNPEYADCINPFE